MLAITLQSDELDAASAVADIIRDATEQLGDAKPVAAFLFASPDYEHLDLLDAIASHWPDLPLVGGTTDGELSTHGFAQESVVLTLLSGEGLSASVGLGRNLSSNPDEVIRAAMTNCTDRTRLCWTTFAPTSDSDAVVHTMQQLAGEHCIVVGGLSGSQRASTNMVEFCGTEVLQDSVPVMFLEGDFEASCGMGSGWFPIGAASTITKCDGHWLHEIDGQPALQFFENTWGTLPATESLGEFPFAIYPDASSTDFYLRAVLEANHATGSMRLAGGVQDGQQVRLTEVLSDGILTGTKESVQNAVAAYSGANPQIAFVFSCAARKWVLGTRAKEDVVVLKEAMLAAGVQPAIAGGYCFGEIGPISKGKGAHFHNETCVTVLIGE